MIKQRTDRDLRLECIRIAATYVTQTRIDASKTSIVLIAKQLYDWITSDDDY